MSVEDTLIRRAILNERFANGLGAKSNSILQEIYNQIELRILREPDLILDGNLNALVVATREILQSGSVELTQQFKDDLLEFAIEDSKFNLVAFQDSSNVVFQIPQESKIDRLLFGVGMDAAIGAGQLTLSEALDQFVRNKAIEVTRIINDGFLEGKTNQQIISDVSHLAKTRSKAQVEALVRTSVNHASSMARKAIVEDNSELFAGEEWVATLDSRTTLICGGRDGRIYPAGQGPTTPAHWNCRSLRVPVLKPEFNIDRSGTKRPEIGADGRGTTNASTKFDSWLRGQPADFQDEYFSQFPDGLEKAALFRRGGLSIQQFRSETGINYTLDELRDLDPVAFAKANIPPPQA